MANGTMSTTLDTLKVADALQKEGGFSEQQAHTLAEQFGEMANSQLVTKEFLKSELEKQELRMTIKFAAVLVAILSFFQVLEHFLLR